MSAESRLETQIVDEPERHLVKLLLSGRIDIFTYMGLAKRLEGLVAADPQLRIAVDFSNLAFVASSGWSVFIATRARLKRGGGSLAFCAMQDDLRRVYESMKMTELVPCYASMEEAVQALIENKGV